MRHFKNIAGYEGVFICGPYPYWLILTSRGELRTHPMSIDWSVPCFAAFNNVNCPQGFIYINRKVKLFSFVILATIFHTIFILRLSFESAFSQLTYLTMHLGLSERFL